MQATAFRRRRLPLAVALAWATGLLGLMSGASADAGVTTLGFNGTSAIAWFFGPPDGCYYRAGFVEALDDRTREQDEPSRTLKVRITLVEDDACNGMGSYDPPIGTAISLTGDAGLAPEDFTVRGDLGTASLRATVALRPSVRTTPCRSSSIELARRGGRRGAQVPVHVSLPGRDMVFYRFMSTSRLAVASGTILDVSGALSMTGAPMIDYGAARASGYISSGKAGDVVISR